MGIEIEVNTLEEMCALMCDNIIPEKEDEKKPRRNENGGALSAPSDDIIS